jgi:hypothetical protein
MFQQHSRPFNTKEQTLDGGFHHVMMFWVSPLQQAQEAGGKGIRIGVYNSNSVRLNWQPVVHYPCAGGVVSSLPKKAQKTREWRVFRHTTRFFQSGKRRP